ncbi:mycothiol system anti-sigma-R factor [Rothia aerolata]|uniref:Putative zinc-finger domain-containing protein n=1 Tax=Rothia aerolata TaxID=1812262 RepID=A0A917IP84_9MICC|nr:mycothiol system anti-sigma-R factor [Rothia aerolata]GGH59346.1 hypothetical protein GCM10007359_06440 [Rothia aerolata]
MTEATASKGKCSEHLTSIYEYLDGALSCDDLQELQDHLAHCETCAKEYDLECVIRSVMKRSCCEPAPADLKTRILQRIDDIRESEHSAV